MDKVYYGQERKSILVNKYHNFIEDLHVLFGFFEHADHLRLEGFITLILGNHVLEMVPIVFAIWIVPVAWLVPNTNISEASIDKHLSQFGYIGAQGKIPVLVRG